MAFQFVDGVDFLVWRKRKFHLYMIRQDHQSRKFVWCRDHQENFQFKHADLSEILICTSLEESNLAIENLVRLGYNFINDPYQYFEKEDDEIIEID